MSASVPPRSAGPLIGLATAAAALGAARPAAALLGVSPPVTVVADAVVDHSPSGLVAWAVSVFGTADKAVLVAGVLLVVAAVACVSGVLALRRPAAGYAVLGAAALAGVAAAWLRRGGDPGAAVPVLVAALVGALVLALLRRTLPAPVPPTGVAEIDGPGGAPGADGPGGEPGTGPPREVTGVGPPQEPTGATGAGGPGGTSGGGADEAGTSGVPVGGASAGPGRRTVLASAGVIAAGAAAGGTGLWLPSALGRGTGPESLRLPAAARALPPLAPGTDLGIPGLSPFFTPAPEFYRIDTALTVPRPDPSRWRLRVHGMVDRPFEIDLDELLRLPLVEADITLTCVSNQVGGDLAGNARWLGYPLADLLRRAGVHADADQVLATSHDGWTCGTPTEVVMDGRNALLAVGMNGEPLPPEHGFPARTVVPGLYGYVSATKWVTDLELTRFADEQAYWTDRGWAERGPVKTMSRIDVPGDFTRVPAGEVTVAGVAWAQHTGIDAVEVRLDKDEWHTAELARVPGIDTWVQWVTEVTVGPGMHALEVRATDATGSTQSSVPVETIPDGAEGWHYLRFTAE
ncbi:Protein-methionine-sulfoxide reductase catalytic subunit MsrP [Nocardiopsis dassonvillei]|uniref:molybdopterin-dependent oxidoreductase n=1 Tax=Nocardiopsis dassonvillei TaxID=2014 RepID=UPI003F54C3DF